MTRKKAILTVAMPVLALSLGFLLALESGVFKSWESELKELAAGGSMVKDPSGSDALVDTLGADSLGAAARAPVGAAGADTLGENGDGPPAVTP